MSERDAPGGEFTLASHGYEAIVAPRRGGSILGLTWHGIPLLRPTTGPSILDVASFPLVPFSNRIAGGAFRWRSRDVRLRANFPDISKSHPLHGFGWLMPWRTAGHDSRHAILEHEYTAGEWPWPYLARQTISLGANGLTLALAVTNLSDEPMPAGIGFHPFFPRTEATLYCGLHHGEWQNSEECLPLTLSEHADPRDWWDGQPVACRNVDTVYTGREGNLRIDWPNRDLALVIRASANLTMTTVYTPAGTDWFCVEPVSHCTDALNPGPGKNGMTELASGDSAVAEIALMATPRLRRNGA
jgi:aldose 1-epimerase